MTGPPYARGPDGIYCSLSVHHAAQGVIDKRRQHERNERKRQIPWGRKATKASSRDVTAFSLSSARACP